MPGIGTTHGVRSVVCTQDEAAFDIFKPLFKVIHENIPPMQVTLKYVTIVYYAHKAVVQFTGTRGLKIVSISCN